MMERRHQLLIALQTVVDALAMGVIGSTVTECQRFQLALHATVLKHGLESDTAQDTEPRAEQFLSDIRRIQP